MRTLLTSILGVAAFLAVAARPAFAGESTQPGSGTGTLQPPAERPAAAPESASGMMVHIDPRTGAIVKEPAPGTVPLLLSPQLRNAFSTSHEGLVEVPVPGGGFKVDLQGRFQSPLVVTIDANGKVKMQHLGEMPVSGDKK